MKRFISTKTVISFFGCCAITVLIIAFFFQNAAAQTFHALKLPDTGQTGDYTPTYGEDSDYLINPPSFSNNGNGTITDNVTGLMWQKTDGGEMTFENALTFADTLTLGGYTDWRLPNSHELYTVLNHARNHPALDTVYFSNTGAEYWWSTDKQIDDAAKIWVANSGGGMGAHLKTETISAGGTKHYHALAVRVNSGNQTAAAHFSDNVDGTITDLTSGLIWQKSAAGPFAWEAALSYCENLSLAGFTDWRLPNIKELQSLNNTLLKNPSIDTAFFKSLPIGNYWSSTTLIGQTTKAWYMNNAYGLITYELKTSALNVLCVRGESSMQTNSPTETLIPGGSFVMGDHHGYVDPQHPSDELPLHQVSVDSFYIGTYEFTNAQFIEYLNSAKAQNLIEVRNNIVYQSGDTNILCYTNASVSYSSIAWNGTAFSIADFRGAHPVVGVMWYGAIACCNWLSLQKGLSPCYNSFTGQCDFSKNGYRLPTEAEWEYAGRGGQYNPYYVFPWGNDSTNMSLANWPSSGDPYESGSYPWTTPIGFYNGQLRLKTDFNWPGAQTSYQTSNGVNAYGLYDMAGNVWEFVNDWYGQNYYSSSPVNNPTGPTSGFIMPDGKPYRGMRGGNWYNGQWGHSRVANRNPSYYRGPQDPNHPWYHVGFRIARPAKYGIAKIDEINSKELNFKLIGNFPNPFNPETVILYSLRREERISIAVFNLLGEEIERLYDGIGKAGTNGCVWNAKNRPSGIYLCVLSSQYEKNVIKLILLK